MLSTELKEVWNDGSLNAKWIEKKKTRWNFSHKIEGKVAWLQ